MCSVQEQKCQQRAAGIAARQAIGPQERARLSSEIVSRVLQMPEFLRAQVIFSYCAMGAEADPSQIDAAARQMGKTVAYPQCCANGVMYAAVPETPETLEKGKLGILEPMAGHCRRLLPEDIDLIIVPCTAFDQKCLRVGMGGGYYDRYLALNPHAFSMAIAFEQQRCAKVAVEAHDKRLDAVVTNTAVYRSEK